MEPRNKKELASRITSDQFFNIYKPDNIIITNKPKKIVVRIYKGMDISKGGPGSGRYPAGSGQPEASSKQVHIEYKMSEKMNEGQKIRAEKTIQEVKQMMESLPPEHTLGINKIQTMTKEEQKDYLKGVLESRGEAVSIEGLEQEANNTLAMVDHKSGLITINIDYPHLAGEERASGIIPTASGLTAHEVGHTVLKDMIVQDPAQFDGYSTYREIDREENNAISVLAFGNENIRGDEAFAGRYRLYSTEGDKLKAIAPKTYKWFKEKVFKGKEYISKSLNLKAQVERPMIYEYRFEDFAIYSTSPIERFEKKPKKIITRRFIRK